MHLLVLYSVFPSISTFASMSAVHLKDPHYVYTAIINIFFIYYFVAQWCCMFAYRLKNEKDSLRRAKIDLEVERHSLENKVQDRTVDLVRERAALEEKVQIRTKELKERVQESEFLAAKYKQKIAELENFQKLTVGRELKMVELKKENQKLKTGLDVPHQDENL